MSKVALVGLVERLSDGSAEGARRPVVHRPPVQRWGSSGCRAPTTWLRLPDVLAVPQPAFLGERWGMLKT